MQQLLGRLVFSVSALAALQLVLAQGFTDIQCASNTTYLFNSLGQSPCQIAANLGSTCDPGFEIDELGEGGFYSGPTEQDDCQCSTVFYSLLAACTVCQGHLWEPWTQWSGDCSVVFITDFPNTIPPNTAVPAWAYLNVAESGTFNPNTATNHDEPESNDSTTQPISSSSTSSSTTSSSASSSTTSRSTSTTSSAPQSTGSSNSSSSSSSAITKSSSNGGLIAGSVVGAVAMVIAFAALVWTLIRLRRARNANSDTGDASGKEGSESGMGAMMGGKDKSTYAASQYATTVVTYSGPTPPPMESEGLPRRYDPDDPSTYPHSPSPRPVVFDQQLKLPYATSFSSTEVPSVQGFSEGSKGASYSGVAEV